LKDEGFDVAVGAAGGAACEGSRRTDTVVIDMGSVIESEVVDYDDLVALRLCLVARGYAFVVCPASHLVTAWLQLRRAGLEPKRTVLVHPALSLPAIEAIVVCRPAKRGGLSVMLAAPTVGPSVGW